MGRMKLKLAALLPAIVLCVSCQQFFTTSLGEAFARDPEDLIPEVTADNAADLAEATKGDSDASLELLGELEDVIADADADEKADLTAVALDVASSASGVENAILQEGDELVDLLQDGDLDDPAVQDQIYGLVEDALEGLDNLSDSSASLVAILTDPGAASIDEIAAASSADDLAMAAIMLLSANASEDPDGVSGYIDSFDSESGTLSESESLAVALAEAAAAKYAAEGGVGPLADLLSTLNLTP